MSCNADLLTCPRGEPSFRELAPADAAHQGQGLLFVNGYLTDKQDHAQWIASFRRMGWRGSVWGLDWQTGGQFLTHLTGTVVSSAVATESFWWSLKLTPGIGPYVTAGQAVKWGFRAVRSVVHAVAFRNRLMAHWKERCLWADVEGQRLGEYLSGKRPSWAYRRLYLVGFSLGARLLYEALEHAGRQGREIADQVDFYGGAVLASCHWNDALGAVTDEVRNFYSYRDEVLRFLYTRVEKGPPIGLHPIELPVFEPREVPAESGLRVSVDAPTHDQLDLDQRITNCDVSDLIRRHADYQTKLDRIRFSLKPPQAR